MLKRTGKHVRDCEKVFADALAGFAIEMRLIDLADLVAAIRYERYGHLADLIHSATELFFKPGTLSFSGAGEVNLHWDRPARAVVNMAFHHLKVSAHLRLMIEAEQAGVQLEYLNIGPGDWDEQLNADCLAAAVADAQLDLPPQAFARYQRAALTGKTAT